MSTKNSEQIFYGKNNTPPHLSWALELLKNKDIFLKDWENYKQVVMKEYPLVAEHLNNMLTCKLIKAFSVPFFTMNKVRTRKDDYVNLYNGICAPTYKMTPEERSYMRYKDILSKMFDFYYFSEADLSYLFKESYSLVTSLVPKLWQAMFIEFKPGTHFDPHEHPPFYLTSINLTESDKYMLIEANGSSVNVCPEEPLLIFDSSYEHIAKEFGDKNRTLLVIGSEI
jgi:hypothetical protein